MSKDSITVESILYANSPEEFFGDLDGATPPEQIYHLQRKYDKCALLIHPQNKVALQQLRNYYQVMLAKLEKLGSPPLLPETSNSSAMIVARDQTGKIAEGDIAEISVETYGTEEAVIPVVYKIAVNMEDNDLIDHESRILWNLQEKQEAAKTVDREYYKRFMRYLPKLITNNIRVDERGEFSVNTLEYLQGFYSLEQVRRNYRDGVEFQTVVWFFNRVLEALGFIHREKIVHGAILPAHIMIRPKDHAAKIIDWTAAVVDPVKNFEHISVMSDAYEDFYPPEVPERQIPSPATDIYMAAKCIVYVLGGNTQTNEMPTNVPDYLQNFIRSCLLKNAHQRPKDAWKLRDEFAVHMKRHYGPPKYHEFKMPQT